MKILFISKLPFTANEEPFSRCRCAKSYMQIGRVRQFIAVLTQIDRPSFMLTPTANLESLISIISMSLDCGREPERPEGTHTDGGRIQKGLSQLARCRKATVQTTASLCHSISYLVIKQKSRDYSQVGYRSITVGNKVQR